MRGEFPRFIGGEAGRGAGLYPDGLLFNASGVDAAVQELNGGTPYSGVVVAARDDMVGRGDNSVFAAYTQHPLYPKEFPIPAILEGAKGEACKSVENFDLTTRPLMDERITQHSTDFIARNAAAGTPFFLYARFTTIHEPSAQRTSSPTAGVYQSSPEGDAASIIPALNTR